MKRVSPQLRWFLGLYVAGVTALALFAYGLRAFLKGLL